MSTKNLLLGSGNVEIDAGAGNGWQPLGLVRGLKLTEEGTEIEIKADNGTVPLSGMVGQKVNVEFSLLDRFLPNLHQFFGGDLVVRAGTATTLTETLPSGLQVDRPRALKHHNSDNSKPTLTAKQANTALAEGTHYRLMQVGLVWHFVLISGTGYDATREIALRYTDLTPPLSYSLSKGGESFRSAVAMRISNRRGDAGGGTVTRTFELFYGFAKGGDAVEFKSSDEADAASPVALKFTFYPDPAKVESEPEKSLYSETHEMSA